MRSATVWARRASSALVGAFTQRKRSVPSGRSTYTPSRNSMWKWIIRFAAYGRIRLDLARLRIYYIGPYTEIPCRIVWIKRHHSRKEEAAMSAFIFLLGLAALAAGAYLYWKSRQAIGAYEASKIVKEAAEHQKVQIKLNSEQMDAIRSQWIKDPNRPAQIIFTVDDKTVGDMKVATCPYFGTTCCATPELLSRSMQD